MNGFAEVLKRKPDELRWLLENRYKSMSCVLKSQTKFDRLPSFACGTPVIGGAARLRGKLPAAQLQALVSRGGSHLTA
jgi:hypothetical protein